jgi:hypothetical protein
VTLPQGSPGARVEPRSQAPQHGYRARRSAMERMTVDEQ